MNGTAAYLRFHQSNSAATDASFGVEYGPVILGPLTFALPKSGPKIKAPVTQILVPIRFMKILLLDQNLFGATRVESNLAHNGHEVALRSALEDGDFGCIVWNFGNPSWTPDTIPAAIEEARSRFPGAKLLGFCGHREVEKWRAAQGAGIKMASNDAMMSDANAVVSL